MSPDQLALLHRIMLMSPAELDELRRNFLLYRQAVDKLRGVIGLQTNADIAADNLQANLTALRAA